MNKKDRETLLVIGILVAALYINQNPTILQSIDLQAAVAGTQTLELYPIADAEVDQCCIYDNFGSSELMRLRSYAGDNRIVYLKFPSVNLDNKNIESATLQVYGDWIGNRNINLETTTYDWQENTITYSSAPSAISLIDSESTGIKGSKWLEFDVLSSVTGNEISFILSDANPDSSVLLDHNLVPKENNAWQQTKLVIHYTVGSVCTPNWSCGSWSNCINNIQTRTCTDLNSCGTTTGKPAESQSCTVTCTPNWLCSSWSSCVNGQQTRTCTDTNNCGVQNPNSTTQSCTTFDILNYWWLFVIVAGVLVVWKLARR